MKLFTLIFCFFSQPDTSQIYIQSEVAINAVKTNKELIEFFKEDVKDSSYINFKVSNEIEYIDAQWFIQDILFEKTGYRYSTHSEEFQSEQLKMFKIRNDFKPYNINQLNTLSGESPFDLMIRIFPYETNIFMLEIIPFNFKIGYTYGIDFIFFFDEKDSIKAFYLKKWTN